MRPRLVVRAVLAATMSVALLASGAWAQEGETADEQSPPPDPEVIEARLETTSEGSVGTTWLLTPLDPMRAMAGDLEQSAVAVHEQTGEFDTTIGVSAEGCFWIPPVVSDGTSLWLAGPRLLVPNLCLGRFPLDGSEPMIARIGLAEAGDQLELGLFNPWDQTPGMIEPIDGMLYFIGYQRGEETDRIKHALYRFDPDATSVEMVLPNAVAFGRSGDKLFVLFEATGKPMKIGGVLGVKCSEVKVFDLDVSMPRAIQGLTKKRHCPTGIAADDHVVAIASDRTKGALVDPQTERITGNLGGRVKGAVVVDGGVWAIWLDKKNRPKYGYVSPGKTTKLESDACQACGQLIVGRSPGAVWTMAAMDSNIVTRIDSATREVTLRVDFDEFLANATK